VTALLFPDNTVLINFVVMGRVDLFAQLAQGRSAWTITVAGECRKSAQQDGLGELSRMPAILGDPWIPTPRERVDMATLRAGLAAPSDPPTQHLGEAEALAILSGRGIASVFVTDDGGARALATSLGVKSASTPDLLKVAVRGGRIDVDEAWDALRDLRHHGRHVSAPTRQEDWRSWCE
jgi:hypothetical protein